MSVLYRKIEGFDLFLSGPCADRQRTEPLPYTQCAFLADEIGSPGRFRAYGFFA